MKIAVITDDGKTISRHFGRAAHYLVCTIEDGKITGRELRDKMGHRQFASTAHDHDYDHEHDHDPRGHGFGSSADRKHASMIASITDCEVLLVCGMGRGAYMALQAANIKPVVTDIESIDAAVQAYIDGDIVDHTDRLH
jgi:predicted Fe-Mo cluster-binding NifX family protein